MKKTLSLLALLEGISYLMLFGITMPMKYMYDMGMPNKIVGMAHGVLFVAYCIFVVLVGKEEKWSNKIIGFGLIASVLPIATFIFDAKVIKKNKEELKAN